MTAAAVERAVRERPILMSAPMVCATLRDVDPKTQTRRVIRPLPLSNVHPELGTTITLRRWQVVGHEDGERLYDLFPAAAFNIDNRDAAAAECPYGRPGDRLWVREAFDADFYWPTLGGGVRRSWSKQPAAFRGPKADPFVFYRADNAVHGFDDEHNAIDTHPCNDNADKQAERWHPSIHMPRWASRITLEITDVRVERVQAISEEDARAEGVEPAPRRRGWEGWEYRTAFAGLWTSLNGPRGYGWGVNPYVWCISFRRITP